MCAASGGNGSGVEPDVLTVTLYHHAMVLSRQDKSLGTRERVNQKARTRSALVSAAARLLEQGRPPSIPDAAAEALVSTATAYRYFTNAEDLWAEAAVQALDLDAWLDEVDREIENAGSDVAARAEVAARLVGGRMLADQRPFRQLVKNSFEQWFAGVQFDGLSDGVLSLRARDEWVREWVDEHFMPTLADQLRGETGWSIQVAWTIDGASAGRVSP